MEIVEKWLSEYDDSLEELKSIRTILEKDFNNVLEAASMNNIILSSRIKSRNSLKEKMYRNKYFQKYNIEDKLFSFLKDSIGIRLICLEHCDEQIVYECIVKANKEGKFSALSFDESLEKQPESQKNGHDIYRINGKINDYKFELQIKSSTHMLWGEIEHLLFYKNYTCVIGERYLKQQIEQLHDDIMSIDQRLSSLKQYVLKDSRAKELSEIKDITRSMLYTELTDRFKSANNNIEVDLRDMYQAITDYLYRVYNHQEEGMKKKGSKKSLYAVFSDINSRIDSKIKDIDDWSIFCDEDYDKPTQITSTINSIVEKLELFLKTDIQWAFFMNTLFISNEVSKGELLRLYSHFIHDLYNIKEDVLSEMIEDGEVEKLNGLYDQIELRVLNNIFEHIQSSRKFNMLHVSSCESYNSVLYLFLKVFIYDTGCEISDLLTRIAIIDQFNEIALMFVDSDSVKYKVIKDLFLIMNSELGCTFEISKYQDNYKVDINELEKLTMGKGE